MPEKVMPGPVEDLSGIREAVCLPTRDRLFYTSGAADEPTRVSLAGARRTE